MKRLRLYRIARVTGQVGWWVFVVAVLLGEATSALSADPAIPERDTCTAPDSSPVWLCASLTSEPEAVPAGVMVPYAVTALGVVILAALIEAITVGWLVPGLITVAAPVLAALLIIDTLNRIQWWVSAIAAGQTLILIVIGLAIRDGWARRFAPGPTSAGGRPD